MRGILTRLRGEEASACGCEPTFEDDRLVVDADDCDAGGRLAHSPDCRATVVEALRERDAEAVLVEVDGIERAYEDRAAGLLVAAGRFVDRVAFHDESLADRARRDPVGAARIAAGRAGVVSEIGAEVGLIEGAATVDGYEGALRPYVGPTAARSRVTARPPPDSRLVTGYELPTDATVRIYERPGRELRTYHVEPVENTLAPGAMAILAAARRRLATGAIRGGRRAARRAVRSVAGPDDPVETLGDVLEKHTRGYGILEDLFADPDVSDVFATAPVADNPLRIRVDGEPMRSNVRLTGEGVAALASRFRQSSGRGFSRANPTLDADADTEERRIRVAGVTDPASDGTAFAFRAHDREAWTLPALVANGTLTADAAALLSLSVERGTAGLVAGVRGAGKTTLLGALLWELPAKIRTIVIEDTQELPIEALQRAGRDVQQLRTGDDAPELSPTAALRAALRLGEGALIVGEVRGEEAAALYEAMRVGAGGSTVLGTIHGDGAAAVRERVVNDLAVAPSAFGATDLVVTLELDERNGDRIRRVKRIEEVIVGVGTNDRCRFAPLYERDGPDLCSTGRLDRGESRLIGTLATPGESYTDLRAALADRTDWFESRIAADETDPASVVAAHAARRESC